MSEEAFLSPPPLSRARVAPRDARARSRAALSRAWVSLRARARARRRAPPQVYVNFGIARRFAQLQRSFGGGSVPSSAAYEDAASVLPAAQVTAVLEAEGWRAPPAAHPKASGGGAIVAPGRLTHAPGEGRDAAEDGGAAPGGFGALANSFGGDTLSERVRAPRRASRRAVARRAKRERERRESARREDAPKTHNKLLHTTV